MRKLLLNADSIAYTSTGTSGKTFLRAIEIMGLQDQIRDRLRPMGAGEPPIAAAKGQVQYAIAPLSRIIAAPGVSPVATFPPELGLDIDMSMFVHRSSRAGPAYAAHPIPVGSRSWTPTFGLTAYIVIS